MMTTKTWNAQSYSNNSQLQYLASKKFFETLLLNGNEKILDIGCGTGLLTREIAEKVPNGFVCGIDSSENMITYANEHSLLQNIEYKLMKAEELCFPHTFDIIVSSFCLHWIKDKQDLFHRIARHLTKDGATRLIMPFRHEEIARIRSKIMSEPKWESYFEKTAAQELLIFDNQYDVYAKEAGLDNINYQTEDVTTIFETSIKLKEFLQNVTSHLNYLPTELQDNFMQEVVDSYIGTHPASENGNCSITYTYGKISSKGIKNN
ncbi:MAG: methyltransferase domain-containing protein [Gammaproteobacteria bacterium]